ncbi:MAG: hypothetical protein DELT_02504 [Desulfovibrio sp.]
MTLTTDATWLMYANIAIWVGLGAYLLYLGHKTARLEARLSRLLHAAGKNTPASPGEGE